MLHWLAAARAARRAARGAGRAPCSSTSAAARACSPRTWRARATATSASTSPASALAGRGRTASTRSAGDVAAVPLADGCADVVVAGEILEHVTDLRAAVGEACRLLRPGGLLVIDTIAATALARFVAVTLAERLPGGPPRGIHDPRLFVDRAAARAGVRPPRRGSAAARHPARPGRSGRAGSPAGPITVRMVPLPTTAVLFQGIGRRSEWASRSDPA